jgi:hypothetical protein
MKKLFPLIALIMLMPVVITGQITDFEDQLTEEREEIPEGWTTSGMFSLSFSQITLTNWAAGGENSISGNGLINYVADYRQDALIWNNSVDIGYGMQRVGGQDARKTDDRIDLLSKAGMHATGDWYYSGLLNFRTQMAPGYDYTNGEREEISNFLSPGYLLGAIGMDYRPVENFSLFIAPITGKFTIVNDEVFAERYGLDPGETVRTEFGGYLRAVYRIGLFENITFQTKLDLFSNYLESPQNIDVNWENLLMARITEYISASIFTHLIYDDDILIGEDTTGDGTPDSFGPRVQFKQLLGIGFSYNF